MAQTAKIDLHCIYSPRPLGVFGSSCSIHYRLVITCLLRGSPWITHVVQSHAAALPRAPAPATRGSSRGSVKLLLLQRDARLDESPVAARVPSGWLVRHRPADPTSLCLFRTVNFTSIARKKSKLWAYFIVLVVSTWEKKKRHAARKAVPEKEPPSRKGTKIFVQMGKMNGTGKAEWGNRNKW